jgi:hypothetical protein
MAQPEQMLDRQLGALGILGLYRITPVPAQAQEDDRDIRPAQRLL